MLLNTINQPQYLYIWSVISDIHIKRPKSHLPPISDHHGDGAVNYVDTGIQ